MTVAGWARKHGFNPRYVYMVAAEKKGKWGIGEAGRIKRQLREDGFLK